MWRVIGAVMLVAAAAVAEPAQSPRRPRQCDPAGGVLFEIDQRALGKRTTSTTLLYANGAWRTKTFDSDGKPAETDQGCLEDYQVKRVNEALRGAKWKVTHTKPSCALSPRWTTYKWKTRTIYTERTCSGDALDADSDQALGEIELYVVAPNLDDATLPRTRHGISQDCLDNPLAKGCN